jgi:predicted nucleic acid-binding protein
VEEFLTRTILLEVDERIAVRAGLMVRPYRKSHGVGLADAIIAATVEVEDARLATLNVKHFPMLPDVLVPYVRQ